MTADRASSEWPSGLLGKTPDGCERGKPAVRDFGHKCRYAKRLFGHDVGLGDIRARGHLDQQPVLVVEYVLVTVDPERHRGQLAQAVAHRNGGRLVPAHDGRDLAIENAGDPNVRV